MDRQNVFRLIINALTIAFRSPVSVKNYMDIVKYIRLYESHRAERHQEKTELASVGYPPDYDPCMHKENIRFCMHFIDKDNSDVTSIISQLEQQTNI